MIGSLITSQTRNKLLKKFFLNSNTKAYLRGLEAELGESTNSIRIELNRLEEAGLLTSLREGNRKFYQSNPDHPLYKDIHSIILKETGIDQVLEKVVHKIGELKSVFLTGDFALGRDSKTIELVLVGDNIDTDYLSRKIVQAQGMVGRMITYILFKPSEAESELGNYRKSQLLLLWQADDSKNDKE